jgi:uncharacterized membrane protein YesL
MLLMVGAAVQVLVMLIATARRSYLAIALPVLAAVGVISALAFWVGWTMVQTDAEMAALEENDEIPAAV